MDDRRNPPDRPPKQRRVVTLLLEAEKIGELVLLFALYSLIPRITDLLHLAPRRLDVSLDHALPFVAAFVLAYGGLYPFCLVPFVYTRTNRYYRRVFAAFAGCMLTGYAVFLVFPVQMVLRPALDGQTGFAVTVVRFIYGHDSPLNCFPSMHVALAQLVAWTAGEIDARLARPAWLVALLITLSTVLIKQHYLADVAGGTLLAYAAYRATLYGYARRNPPDPADHRSPLALLIPAGLYLGLVVAAIVAWRLSG